MTETIYKDRIRNRACAVITSGEWLLLLKHQSPTRKAPIWMPPGGGLQFGEPVSYALKREVKEETGLFIEPLRMIWIHEFIEKPYHAIEYYYECSVSGGALKLGEDPEHPKNNQILLELKFISFEDIQNLPVYPEFLKEHCKPGKKLPDKIMHVQSITGIDA